MGEADIELGHMNTNTTEDYGLQQFLQEVQDFEKLLDNAGSIVQKLKVKFISVSFGRKCYFL